LTGYTRENDLGAVEDSKSGDSEPVESGVWFDFDMWLSGLPV